MIILEGPDNSGKSTLGKILSEKLHLEIVHPGGKPDNPDIELSMILNQMKLSETNIIHDRITCISNMVYNIFRGAESDIDYSFMCDQFANSSTIIYCRPPMEVLLNLSNHVVKEHDSVDQINLVNNNCKQIIIAYDTIMQFIHHIPYDYTSDSIDELIHDIKNSEDWNGIN